MRCIITGCALVDDDKSCWAWGDLFVDDLAQVYIFNACVDTEKWTALTHSRRGETAWHFGIPVPPGSKALSFTSIFHEVFDKRGVVVIPKGVASLNLPAQEYLRDSRSTVHG
jgi:hypothetical protein